MNICIMERYEITYMVGSSARLKFIFPCFSANHLSTGSTEPKHLDWLPRLRIAEDAAKGSS